MTLTIELWLLSSPTAITLHFLRRFESCFFIGSTTLGSTINNYMFGIVWDKILDNLSAEKAAVMYRHLNHVSAFTLIHPTRNRLKELICLIKNPKILTQVLTQVVKILVASMIGWLSQLSRSIEIAIFVEWKSQCWYFVGFYQQRFK